MLLSRVEISSPMIQSTSTNFDLGLEWDAKHDQQPLLSSHVRSTTPSSSCSGEHIVTSS